MPGFLGSGGAADSLLSYPSGTQGPVEDSRTTRRLSETPFSKVASPHFTLSSCHSASHEPGSKKKLGPTVGFLLGVTISPWHGSETKRWSRKWGRAGCIHLNVYMLSSTTLSSVEWRRTRLSSEVLAASRVLRFKEPSSFMCGSFQVERQGTFKNVLREKPFTGASAFWLQAQP